MQKIRQLASGYPRQFWILFGGLLVYSTGSSMVWPFLTIIVRQRLNLPLTTIALLLTINSATNLLATYLAGPITDRFGRKGVMLLSMSAASLIYLSMSTAGTYSAWAFLMAANGTFLPIFRVGSDAMVADLIVPEKRANAYSLIRMINNLGIAIGPSIGGFIAAVSYARVFYIAATTSAFFALIILFLVAETLPRREVNSNRSSEKPVVRENAGYRLVFQDRPFLIFCLLYVFTIVGYSMIMVLLPVYAKENYGVIESQFGFIMATNAVMVVLFQYFITSWTRHFNHLLMLALGAFFYAIGVGSIALGTGFSSFIISMVIVTIGEMILIPTSTTLTANLAPPEMRGRYMSIYSLTWGLAIGVGPVVGGLLNDHVAPVATWIGGMLAALVGMGGFLLLLRLLPQKKFHPSNY